MTFQFHCRLEKQMASFETALRVLVLGLLCSAMGAQAVAAATDPPVYAIGSIPDQRIWFHAAGSQLEFGVSAPTFGGGATISISYDRVSAPAGPITFDDTTARFRYQPAATDSEPFQVTFLAVGDEAPVVQQITIQPMQPLPPESEAFGVGPNAPLPDPTGRDYLAIDDVPGPPAALFNDAVRATRQITVAGKTVVLEEGHPNGLYERVHGQPDIRSLEIFTETLVIRDSVHLPQTDVTIHAFELIFEDRPGQPPVTLSTVPLIPFGDTLPPARDEAGFLPESTPGHKAGSLALYARSVTAEGSEKRFILRGGKGRRASPGKDGAAAGSITALKRDALEYNGQGTLPNDFVIAGRVVITDPIEDRYAPSQNTYNARNKWAQLQATDGPAAPGPGSPGGLPGRPGAGGNVVSAMDVAALVDNGGGAAGEPAPTAKGGRGVIVLSAAQVNGKPKSTSRTGYVFDGKLDVTVVVFPPSTKYKFTHKSKSLSAPDGADAPGPNYPEAERTGPEGDWTVLPDDLRWLTPEALRLVRSYLSAAYMDGHFDFVRTQLEAHLSTIDKAKTSPGWNDLAGGVQADLQQLEDDFQTLLERVRANLDYFGNPAGWAPMLSFEVNYAAFENEISRALRIMYLHHWLGNKASNIEERRRAMRAMRAQLLDQIEQDRATFSQATRSIPGLRVQAEDLQNEIDVVLGKIKDIEQAVLKKAKNIVAAKRAARTLGKIAQTFPVGQPALGLAGGAVAASADIDPNRSWEENGILVAQGAAQGFASGKAAEKAAAAQRDMDNIDTGSPETVNDPAVLQALRDSRAPLVELMKDTGGLLLAKKASDPEVAAEMQRLLAEIPEFRALRDELEALHESKRDFAAQISSLLQNITVLPIAISRNLRGVDQINQQIAGETAKLDSATLSYLAEANARARARLLRYHYYMARAYAYRRLEAYPGALDLNAVFDKIREFAATDTEEIDPQHFESLRSVYESQISAVAEKILGDANQTPPEKSVSVVFKLPQEIVDQLNAGQTARLNLKDLALFPESEENLRITDLAVTAMDLEVDPSGPAPNAFALVFKHSGISELQQDGRIFLFRHYNESTRNAITWKTAYHFIGGNLESARPSAASQSLIGALVNKSPRDILIYSRPAVFADLLISSESNTPGAKVRVKDATVSVHYDYTEKSSFIHTLKLAPGGNGVGPEIQVAAEDRNGRKNGRGTFERVYDRNTVVTITAPEREGTFEFVRWEGAPLADPTSRSVTLPMDQEYVLRPVYASAVQYSLTVIGGSGSGTYDPGTVVPIAASPPAGTRFVRWNGANPDDPLAASTTVPLLDSTSIEAVFAPPEQGAALSITGVGASTLDLKLNAGSDATWELQSSADLVNWTPLATLPVSGGTAAHTVPADGSRYFYRAVLSR